MRTQRYWLVVVMALSCEVTLAQMTPQNRHLVVNGKAGDATVVQLNGRTYVDLEALVRVANGSLSFQNTKVSIQLPNGEANASATPPNQEPPAAPDGLTRNFMVASIETLAQMREWASTLASVIQHGYGITESWAADYREKAASSLRQASASATTNADHNAVQLLTNEFQNVEMWSNELVEAKKKMDTAKYSTSADALRNEPLSQKIINCGRFLGTMLGSATFSDDPSCH